MNANVLKMLCLPLVIVLAFPVISYCKRADKASDAYIRERVVLLESDSNACSGIQVKAPSGKTYILTAAHCRSILSKQNTTTAIDEQGNRSTVKLEAINIREELMLLSPINNKSINVGKKIAKHEHIHTLTHGGMMPTYRTDGEVLEEKDSLGVVISKDAYPSDYKACVISPRRIQTGLELFGFCVYRLRSLYTTALVIPGSSGGPVLNERGELVGIVSVTDGYFSGVAILRDITDFLKDK